MSWPLRHSLRAIQRSLVMLALAGFIAGTVGVPLPIVTGSGKDRSEPFPCMDRQCGCQSAAQCWRGCCCFTNKQKLAWARERGIAPPEFVVRAAKREQATVAACCSAESGKVEMACSDSSCEDDRHEIEPTPSASVGFVLAAQARQCQGQAELWLALGAVAPLPSKTQVEHDELVLGTACIAAEKLSGISQRPVTPPPRV